MRAALLAATAIAVAGCHGPERGALDGDAMPEARSAAAACDRGDPAACTNLGAMYADGEIDATDAEERAVRLFEHACAAGATVACTNLAGMLPDGEALPLLRTTCARDARACLALGDRAADVEERFAAYTLACDARLLRGCAERGARLLTGTGTAVDANEGAATLRSACHDGGGAACLELARELRRPGTTAGNPEHARALLERACSGGEGEACALRAEYAETPEDAAQAAVFRRRGCELGWAPACE